MGLHSFGGGGQGDALSYNRIVTEVTAGNAESLLPLYQAFLSCVSVLAKNPEPFKELIAGMFGASTATWLLTPMDCAPTRDRPSAATSTPPASLPHVFFEFTLQLVSANCCFLPSVLHALVRALVPSSTVTGAPSSALVVVESSSANGAGPSGAASPVATAASLLVFRLLKQVLRLVPAGVSTLFRVLSDHFPHKRHPAKVHAAYVTHLLHIADELPPLQDRIFAIVVEKMILIDVRRVLALLDGAPRPAW
jgi:hypothetical protein